jgi:hypothetical protein
MPLRTIAFMAARTRHRKVPRAHGLPRWDDGAFRPIRRVGSTAGVVTLGDVRRTRRALRSCIRGVRRSLSSTRSSPADRSILRPRAETFVEVPPGPWSSRASERREASSRANGTSVWCGGDDGVEPPTLKRLRRAGRRGCRSSDRTRLGPRSVIGADVGVVAEKNGQATVATETSRRPLLRVARRGLPL